MPRLAFIAVPIVGDVLNQILGCCTPQTTLPLHRISGRRHGRGTGNSRRLPSGAPRVKGACLL